MSQGDFLSKVFMKELKGEITYECSFIYSLFFFFFGGGLWDLGKNYVIFMIVSNPMFFI